MTASQRAKQLGAKSLQQVAGEYGYTVQGMRKMHGDYPDRFEIIVLGVVAKMEKNK